MDPLRTRNNDVEHGLEDVDLRHSSQNSNYDRASSKSRRHFLGKALECIQNQRTPSCLVPQGTTPPLLINGIDLVLYGTQPAAEVVTVLGKHPPRYLCYMISGSACDIIQFGIDVILHEVLLLQDDSVCWALGFGASIIFRHTTHRYLVFGDYVGGYWSSLGRMYAGYSIIIVLSTFFNVVMTKYAQFPHYIAWVITLLWTGIVNYFILKKLWTFGGSNVASKPKTDADEKELVTLQPTNKGAR